MSKLDIEFDFNNLMAGTPRCTSARGRLAALASSHPHGLTDADFAELASRAKVAAQSAAKHHRLGGLGFIDLPDNQKLCREIEDLAGSLAKRFDDFVVLGIGGSALGNRALDAALARRNRPRVWIADNADPTLLAEILSQCDLKKTVFNVISKSGGTAETAAQFLICWDAVLRAVGKKRVRSHFVITTDPQKGPLCQIAASENISSLPVPPNVGGRFSVLSASGLLSAAVAGIQIRKLLSGAAKARAICKSDRIWENPALTAATALYWFDIDRGKPIQVFMPYAHRLRFISDWFVQLAAESLGKKYDRQGRVVHAGPTPIKAIGATDQHSQLQLYLEGPFDKVVTFLTVKDFGTTGNIPKHFLAYDELSYLGGHSLTELMHAEQRGTELALTRNGRPNCAIRLKRVDEESVGALLFLLEMQTAYLGELYNINAFDQPGVEQGKQYACGLIGRKGYEKFAAEAQSAEKKKDRYVVRL